MSWFDELESNVMKGASGFVYFVLVVVGLIISIAFIRFLFNEYIFGD